MESDYASYFSQSSYDDPVPMLTKLKKFVTGTHDHFPTEVKTWLQSAKTTISFIYDPTSATVPKFVDFIRTCVCIICMSAIIWGTKFFLMMFGKIIKSAQFPEFIANQFEEISKWADAKEISIMSGEIQRALKRKKNKINRELRKKEEKKKLRINDQKVGIRTHQNHGQRFPNLPHLLLIRQF